MKMGTIMSPTLYLDSIGHSIIKLNLFVNIPEKTNLFNQNVLIYRARQHKPIEEVNSCDDIGSPPNDKACSNRFSAEGISMFYGAENEKNGNRRNNKQR